MGSASGVCGERRTRTQSVERQPTTPASSKATSTTQTPADLCPDDTASTVGERTEPASAGFLF